MDPLRVLIVDDDASSRRALELCLRQIGHEPLTTEDGDRALEAAEEEVFDVALVDLRLDGASGLDVIEALRERAPWIQAVVVTAHGSIESAVRSVRKSAVDYLTKPVDPETLDGLLRRLSSVRDLEQGLEELREEMDRAAPPPALQAVEPAMLTVYDTAKRAAETDATILIRGESGTGKGVLARAIHQWSPRVDRPFSTVSAPSLSPELLESELFGHVKGAFTGAVRSRPGRIARARGGTLFLDEIGELPLKLQPKLLRVLQERRFERVGSDKTLDAEVRWIVASNRDLESAVEEGTFREDLYYRVRVVEVRIPPLRERRDDILPLARHFLSFYASRYGRPGLGFSSAAERTLVERDWPGNVRELQNAIERAVILASGSRIAPDALPDQGLGVGAAAGVGSARLTLDEVERRHIARVLEDTDSTAEAAAVLGVSRSTLWRRRRKHDL